MYSIIEGRQYQWQFLTRPPVYQQVLLCLHSSVLWQDNYKLPSMKQLRQVRIQNQNKNQKQCLTIRHIHSTVYHESYKFIKNTDQGCLLLKPLKARNHKNYFHLYNLLYNAFVIYLFIWNTDEMLYISGTDYDSIFPIIN